LGSTISIGIADLSAERTDSASLKEQADAALYEAKRRGRNLVVIVDELEDFDVILSSAKMQALRTLLRTGGIEIAFQPIWDIKSGSVLGLEALARLPADCGLDGPQEAFDIAEKIGRAHDLDALCRQAVLARAAELPSGPLLFLNVSPQSLDHDNLAGNALVEAVRNVGLQPERIVLELTERSFARPHVVIREARRLQRLGFRLALDDTGAGNSGLEMLSQLDVDFVKIDRNVIVNAMNDRSARGVLAGIIAIAQQTEAYVIAEGLEDEAMFSLVTSIGTAPSPAFGVHGAQGYLFGRPTGDVRAAMRMPAAAPTLAPEDQAAIDPLTLIA
jgi:EAL domain-containing protein (putative c-di-GMP-specific phosphodiesterase class I)